MIFRYPGGKGKLVKRFLNYIPETENFADVFVGGGSVALAVATRSKNTRVYLNDADPWVSNFWSVLVGASEDFKSLIDRVEGLPQPTLSDFKTLRTQFKPEDFAFRLKASNTEAAFCVLFFNRTTFGGILSSGPIGGEDQESAQWKVDARWNSVRLVKELKLARKVLFGRTEVTNFDFAAAIKQLPSNCFVYADPPYFQKGDALYGVGFSAHHERLHSILTTRSNWLLSYDSCPQAKTLYAGHKQIGLGKQFRSMSSQTERPEDESEIIIFSKETSVATKETFVDEKGVPRYTDSKRKVRESRKTSAAVSEPEKLPSLSSMFNEKQSISALHDQYQKGSFTKQQFIEALQS